MTDSFRNIFDAERFRELGHEVVDLLADHLKASLKGDGNVVNAGTPEEEFAFWSREMERPSGDSASMLRQFVDRAIHLHHPRYMGHQVSAPAPVAAVAGFVSGLLNNGMAVYEMGPSATALERWIIEKTASLFGFPQGSGFLTSGGTLAMTTALLAARTRMLGTSVLESGTEPRWSIMASSEAHYCSARAVHVMGWGRDGFVRVPVDARFKMRTDLLDECFEQSVKNGRTPVAVVGSACTTSTGSYDNLEAIADFCGRRRLWFHVDGAHGAAVAFCTELREKIAGLERADSVVLDFHKLLLTPALATAVIFRDHARSWAAFEQKAQYLWDASKQGEWFNGARRTFECTKLSMSLKIAAIWRAHGREAFAENVRRVHANAVCFYEMLCRSERFEVATAPESNIVCFRALKTGIREDEVDALQLNIREKVVSAGSFYFVQTTLNGRVWLRTALMNPFTQPEDLSALLERLERAV
jgi:L-2,4-diaminobutyrate decarboxylase